MGCCHSSDFGNPKYLDSFQSLVDLKAIKYKIVPGPIARFPEEINSDNSSHEEEISNTENICNLEDVIENPTLLDK